MVGLVLAMFMAAIEGTIVATAMPSIAASLGGFALYAWVFSAYLLMQAVGTPVFGKLADLMGRKPVFVAGVSIFLAGSLACGLATSMPALIAFRLVQGLGAGAVQPVTVTLAGDLYGFRERARIQAWLSSVWGLSAVAGPLAGGLIVQHLDWSWIFWLHLPVGVLAAALVAAFLHERVEPTPRRIDVPGVAAFAVCVASAIVLLSQGALLSFPVAAALGAIAVGTGAWFWRHERSAAEPMIPPALWRDRLVRTANLATLASGGVMIAVVAYLPSYAQGVLGTSALVAGFTLTTMSLGWPLASVTAGRMLPVLGARMLARAGGVALLTGALGLQWLGPEVGPVWAAASSGVVGIGMGLVSTTFLVAIQTRMPWSRRGAATSTNLLMRLLGNALGAALLGGIVNARLRAWLEREGLADTVDLEAVTRLLEGAAPAAAAELPPGLRDGLAVSIETAFVATVVAAVAALALTFAMPDLTEAETA